MLDLASTITIDLETYPAGQRPDHPPRPVGVAIKYGAAPSEYLAFAHPHKGSNAINYSNLIEAKRVLAEAFDSGRPLLFHNGLKFDLDVIETHLGLARPPWRRCHDTLPALFLADPRAADFQLKSSCQRLLGDKPDERDAVVDWIVDHQPVAGRKLTKAKNSGNYAGAFVAYAPADLVGAYACADVDMTWRLAGRVFPEIEWRCMGQPYDVERELAYHLLDMERRGILVDRDYLAQTMEQGTKALAAAGRWLGSLLGVLVNLDSGPELADALIRAGYATEKSLGRTESGALATSKDALARGVNNRSVLMALRYRAAWQTCLSTFVDPWLAASESTGRIFTSWNSTRQDRGNGSIGTRTGRLSSTPNLQNVPKAFANIFDEQSPAPFAAPPLPDLRRAIVAGQGRVLCGRDFNSQELRVLAHFEDGPIMEAYKRQPSLDLHQAVADKLAELRHPVGRKRAKALNFAILYGVGLSHLAEMLAVDRFEAETIRAAYFLAFPSVRDINAGCRARFESREPIRTLGGREYYCEPPKMGRGGEARSFAFRALNLLIQGSSADLTKQAMIDYANDPQGGELLLSVHDELAITVDEADAPKAMARLRDAMEKPRLDVPILSEGYTGSNWGELKAAP